MNQQDKQQQQQISPQELPSNNRTSSSSSSSSTPTTTMITPTTPTTTTPTTPNNNKRSKNKIKVSSAKSVFFYVDLATRFLKQENEVELSGLGYAITTVVTISEILKNNGIAEVKKIITSTMDVRDRPTQKAKIQIILEKSKDFDTIIATKMAASQPASTPTPTPNTTTTTSTPSPNRPLKEEPKN